MSENERLTMIITTIGSVIATYLWYGGACNNQIKKGFTESVNEFSFKLVNTWQSHKQ